MNTDAPIKTHRSVGDDQKKLEYYLKLKYPIEIVEEEDGIVATIPDLPGCASFGDTIEEAVRSVNATKEIWIRGQIESGQRVPEPNRVDDFSGKFVLRIPRVLHKSLDREAKRQGVSLNQYILHLLSERNAITVLRVGAQHKASAAALADLHALWEERICTYSFRVHSGTRHSGEGLLSKLDLIHKAPKDFKTVITPMQHKAAYQS